MTVGNAKADGLSVRIGIADPVDRRDGGTPYAVRQRTVATSALNDRRNVLKSVLRAERSTIGR